MKKRETIMFIVFVCIIIAIAGYKYVTEAKNRHAISSDVAMCSYMEDVVNMYDDLAQCDTWGDEFIENYDSSILSHFDGKSDRRFLVLGECCSAYKQSLPLSRDKYDVFFTIMEEILVPVIFPLLILFFGLFNLNLKFKSKYAYYYLQRKSYKSFLIKTILSVYKYALALPILYLAVYLFALNITNHGPIDMVLSLKGISDYVNYVGVPGFWICYYLTGFLFGAFIINIGMIFLHKNGKLIFSIIGSFLTYFYIYLIDQLFIHVDVSVLVNFVSYSTEYSIYYVLINILVFFIVSFIAMLYVYKDKKI